MVLTTQLAATTLKPYDMHVHATDDSKQFHAKHNCYMSMHAYKASMTLRACN